MLPSAARDAAKEEEVDVDGQLYSAAAMWVGTSDRMNATSKAVGRITFSYTLGTQIPNIGFVSDARTAKCADML
jgi:tetrahydromethanopterin S-methyltransferase subunit C